METNRKAERKVLGTYALRKPSTEIPAENLVFPLPESREKPKVIRYQIPNLELPPGSPPVVPPGSPVKVQTGSTPGVPGVQSPGITVTGSVTGSPQAGPVTGSVTGSPALSAGGTVPGTVPGS